MPLIAPAYETINPSLMLPEIILPYSQASGAFNLLPNEEPRVMLGEGDLAVYIRRIDVRTKNAAGQAAYNALPSPDIVVSQISTATYLMRVRAEYDHHDMAAAGRYGFSLTEATRLANQQAIVNTTRTALLYGFNPANGEGLLNANGATFIPLPPDSNGNDSIVTYDNGQMAFFLQGQVLAIKTRTNALGRGRKFTILGPQRTMGAFEYNVVQVTQFQRIGAGTTSTAGVVKEVLMTNGDTVIWAYDDTLIGKGAGGTDAIIIAMPEVEKPRGSPWNTNKFAELSPGFEATMMQLADMAAPREITVPLPAGAVDTLFEERITSGWAIRPEAITIISALYQ
jgi:hypothetical protein